MKSGRLFSIVTVTRNDLAGLHATAASIREQTSRDYEWIVIDGASSDETPRWLADNAGNGDVVVSEPDRGTYDAMNKGLDRATGRYVVFLNSGDTLASPDTLGAVGAAVCAAEVEPDLVYGDSIDVPAGGNELYRRSRRHVFLPYGMFTSHQAMYFRRARRPELRYDLQYPRSADFAFVCSFLRADAAGQARCLYLPRPLCRFSLGGQHFTNREQAMLEDFRIRRRVLGQPLAMAAALYALHRLHHATKLAAPWLTRRLRYDTAAGGPSRVR
ncbi:MAG TPA: glycosyltransferase family 2 protein [Candidatus Limnocylindrales bacterium]|nr:glycosyltransferase family 2 protein [Candidatus Limnocylindrales bacterium]